MLSLNAVVNLIGSIEFNMHNVAYQISIDLPTSL